MRSAEDNDARNDLKNGGDELPEPCPLATATRKAGIEHRKQSEEESTGGDQAGSG